MRKLSLNLKFVAVCVAALLGVLSVQTEAGLLAHWRFDEASGLTAFDSADSYDGTLRNGAVFSPGTGIARGAITLDQAIEANVEVGDYFSFSSGAFSVHAWVKINPALSFSQMFVLSKHNQGSANGYYLSIFGNGFVYFVPDGAGSATSRSRVNDGEWHQIVNTFRNNGTVNVYIDGVLEEQNSGAGSITPNSAPFLIGSLSNRSAGVGFTGLIDEVQVYDHALSAGEVRALYESFVNQVPEPKTFLLAALALHVSVCFRCRNGWSGCFPELRTYGNARFGPLVILAFAATTAPANAALTDGLISYWPFDGDGADASGFDRGLTLQGGVGFAAGLFGQALDMHKSQNTYAQRLVDDEAYDFRGDFTVQAWVRYYSTSTEQVLIEKFIGETGGGGWTFTKLASNTFQFSTFGLNVDSSPQSIPLNVCHQLIARRNGSEYQIWCDEIPIASVSEFGRSFNAGGPLYIGRRNPGDTRNFSMNGRLDEVAIWSRPLSDAEIAYLYNGGLGNPVSPIPEPTSAAPSLVALACFAMHCEARRGRRLNYIRSTT
jgi:hypothetical protein